MSTKRLHSTILAAGFALAASTLHAAPIFYFGEDLAPGGTVPAGGNAETARQAFLDQLVGVGSEDFESFANLTPITGAGINVSFPGTSGSITATLTGSNGGVCDQTVGGTVGALGCGFSRFATSPNNYLQNETNMSLAFSAPISAFGFYGTDFGDFSGVVDLTLVGASTAQTSVPAVGANGNLLFWGFIDPVNTYTSVQFSTTGFGDVFGFDDFVIGDRGQLEEVPVPGTLALILLGLAPTGIAFRRRRKA